MQTRTSATLTSSLATGNMKKRSITTKALRSIRLGFDRAVSITTRSLRKLQKRFPVLKKRPVRIGILLIVAALIVAEISNVLQPYFNQNAYALGTSESLIPEISNAMASRLVTDNSGGKFTFSATAIESSEDVARPTGQDISATAYMDPSKGVSVTDPVNKIDFSLKPKFSLMDGRKDGNRVVYPLKNGSGWAVYTMQASGVKEDIILTRSSSDTAKYEYELGLGDSLEARLEADGSIGIYGNTLFSSNISTGSDADAALLVKARQAADKDTYLFGIPKPVVVEKDVAQSAVTARYILDGSKLTVDVSGLKQATYPLSIDPSIYVVTAQQFMQGNNETNVDFDVSNKLIKKAPTTGARFDTWNTTSNLPTPAWASGTAATGGYVYSAGGIALNGQIYNTQGTQDLVVPAGVTSITVKMWGAGGGGGAGGATAAGGGGGAGGYVTATLTVTPGETLTVYVGGGGGGGTINTTGGGGAGGGFTIIYRSASILALAAGGGGGGGARAGSAGTAGGAGGGTTGVAGTASGVALGGGAGTPSTGGSGGTGGDNPGSSGASLTGGAGADGLTAAGADGSGTIGGLATGGAGGAATNTTRGAGGGGGAGYFGGGGGAGSTSATAGAGGGGGSSFTAVGATGVTNTAGSGTTPANSTDEYRNSAGDGGTGGAALGNGAAGKNGIAVVTFGSGSSATSQAVNWAQLNTTTGSVDSPNPGSGACSGWCTTSAYNLPAARSNLSLVAYNGFLYAFGGTDGTGTRQNSVYIAKIGANGEPRLWHPTDTNQNNWVYWYTDTNLSSVRSDAAAVAYNNRMYLIGGRSTSGPVTTVEVADINPTGTLGTWTASTALGTALYGHGAQVYNDRLYVIGGANTVGGAPVATVSYNKINSNGTLNSWVSTNSFASGRIANGGNFTVVWGAYLYISGGCTAVNGSGYCTATANDTQVASINADGSIDIWNSIGGVSNQRMGFGMVAWRDKIYEIGGCSAQNASTGDCDAAMENTITYGDINRDGDASTVGQSAASGTAPCSGVTPTGCNLPGTANIGNMLSSAFISNGYLYVVGGCTNDTCSTTTGNVAYVAISSTGVMSKPATCPVGAYQGQAWCVDTTNVVSGGLAAASPVIFGGRVYLVGGLNGTANTNTLVRSTLNNDGSISAWTSQTLTGLGAVSVSYLYAYARANPASAGTNPGNLYIFGGCATSSAAGCTAYSQGVYKCNIQTSGAVAACSTTSQLQIGILPGDTATGLGIMSGTVYANYVYLIGGVSPNQVDLRSVRYAKIDSNNNIVTAGTGWVQSTNLMQTGRRRAAAFGYNGYIYVVGGYEGTTGVLADIEFIKVNVSDGSLGSASEGFQRSAIKINQRWGLSVPVSNSFAYVIGGCTVGASPSGCTSRTDVIQTFQLYNNDSGAPAGYATSANTYGTNPSRIGASSTILNGYIYTAGGCTGTSDCMNVSSNISYAPIDTQGAIGTWASTTGSLPAGRAWGKLLAAGNSLYYAGGQDSDGIPQSSVYYGTPSSGDVSSWSTASNGLPGARTRFGATVWNNRLYVVGGNSTTQNTVVYNTAGTGTFVVPTGVTSLVVKAWGAGGGGGNGSGGTGIGGGGGGGGFAQATLTVTAGSSLTYNVGTAGAANTTASYAGNGGGFTALLNGATYLIQAGGGAGGGGTTGTANGGQGGAGGGTSGTAGTAGSGTATVGGLGGAGTAAAGGAGGAAGTGGVAGNSGAANNGGDAGGSLTSCTTAVTGRGGNGGVGAGGKGGISATCVNGGGGGGGRFGGGGGGSGSNAAVRGGGGGGGGSSLVTGATTTQTAGSAGAAGVGGAAANNTDLANNSTAGKGGNGSTGTTSTSGQPGLLTITYGTYTPQATVYVSPQLNSGGDIGSAWSTSSTSFNVARMGTTAVAYANNLYVFGGDDGTNFLSDTQYSQINSSTGAAGTWTYSASLPGPLSGSDGFAANGYVYLLGGRSSASTCDPVTLVAPISANTTIASGNNPTGIGEWFETNQRFTGARYGSSAAYYEGKAYVLGGGCGSTLTYASPVTQQTTLLSQPQVAKYSIAIDTDTDVFPSKWLLNGIDNSVGAAWQLKYRSMTNTTTSCASPAMTTWGTETVFGNVTLGLPGAYIPRDGSNVNTNCARFYYFNVTVDSSRAFGYPDDVTRGPTITDLTLQFTADPSKRLMHGRTFTGGLQQPLDTPF